MKDEQLVKQIRDQIEARGLKVKFIANEIGVAPSTLSCYLTGKRNLGTSAKKLLFKFFNLDEALMQSA